MVNGKAKTVYTPSNLDSFQDVDEAETGVNGRISTSDICAILEGEKRVSGGRVDLDSVSGVFRLRAASSNYR